MENDWYKEKEKEKVTEMEYNIKIEVKKDVDDKIRWLTANYPEEISAFLTGEIKDGVVTIDGMLFPHQDVSGASVEVEPKNLIKLRKEYGNECLRIIGHWHSHNTMGAFWSTTDDTFINSYSKTKEISVFFVSSVKSEHRVMLVMNKPFEIKLDNMGYDVIWNNQKFEADLLKVIDEKVTKRVYTPQVYTGVQSTLTENTKEDMEIRINESISYNAETGNIVVKELDLSEAQVLMNDTTKELPQIRKNGIYHDVIYRTREKTKAIQLIKDIKFYLEEIFGEEKQNFDYGYWGGY